MTTNQVIAVLGKILRQELSLPTERVVRSGENFKVPHDPDLYIVVGLAYSQIISSTRHYTDRDTAEQGVNMVGTFNIDLTSEGQEATDKHQDAVMALKSHYSEQLQETHGIKISRGAQVMDLSFAEKPASIKRFRITANVHYTHTIERPVDNFDKLEDPVVIVDSNSINPEIKSKEVI